MMQKSLNGLRVSNLAQIILGLGCAFALGICRPEPIFEKVETGFRNATNKADRAHSVSNDLNVPQGAVKGSWVPCRASDLSMKADGKRVVNLIQTPFGMGPSLDWAGPASMRAGLRMLRVSLALAHQLGAQVETVAGPKGTTVSVTHATFLAKTRAA
jgi:hypothetical protein